MKRSPLVVLVLLTSHIMVACGDGAEQSDPQDQATTLQQHIVSGGGATKAAPIPDPDPTPICPTSLPQCQTHCVDPLPQVPDDNCCLGTEHTSCSMLDSDGDGLLRYEDNCPIVYNPQQENSDYDIWGDACDNCPTYTSNDLYDYDGDGIGDLCDDETYRPTRNVEAINIGVPYCDSNGYSLIDNCINDLAPEEPSIYRGISKGEDFYDHMDGNQYPFYKLPIDDKVISRAFHVVNAHPSMFQVPQAGQTQALPPERASHDGRLLLSGNTFLTYKPETNGTQQRVLAGKEDYAIQTVNYYDINQHDILYNSRLCNNCNNTCNEGEGQTCVCYSDSIYSCEEAFEPRDGSTLCENKVTNPTACKVKDNYASNALITGDCYDVSLLQPATKNGLSYLISSDLTVYIKDPKSLDAHVTDHGGKTRVFPRVQDYTDIGTLYDFPSEPFTTSQSTPLKYTTDCECTDIQKCRPTELFGAPTELTTTSDGKLLFVNGNGVSYAYSEGDGCNAEEFTLFKPLSCFPMDPRVSHYPLAQNVREYSSGEKAFTDTQGNKIKPGEIVLGAYPWIDRDGRNIFYADIVNFRDGWKAVSQSPAQLTEHGIDLLPDQSNIAKGNGIVALGAWTQGKVIVMDNLMNSTDWTGRTSNIGRPQGGAAMNHNFKMALYQTVPRWIRPASVSLINSAENQLNYLKGQTPTLPFDVVWNMTTTRNQNSEVIFDEYMTHNAFVVAHMNAPHTRHYQDDNCGKIGAILSCSNQPDDGFVPNNPGVDLQNIVVGYGPQENLSDRPDYQFQRNPKIQNASTSWPERAPFDNGGPKSLRLRGGARIEPVALGGVRGKGIYLDGINDFIDMGFPKPNHDDWFYGIWLDPRDQSTATRHTVFFWPDESWVALNGDTLYAYDSTTQLTHDVPLGQDLEPGKYFHLGVKIHHQGTTQLLEVYINGTHIDSVTINNGQGFDLNFYDQSWFAVGDPGPGFTRVDEQYRNTWKGWVDEFRIYALDEQSTDHFDEFICNLAMGSLMNQNGQEVCEQLDLDAKGHPVDTPQQNGLTCADKAHQLGTDPSCLRASKLGIAPMDPQLPRPDFQQNHFCNTCHIDNHSMIELDVQNALFGSTTNMPNREDDPRRQPMDWPRHVYGVEMQPSDVTTSQSYNVYDYSVSGTLDYYFHMMPSPEKL